MWRCQVLERAITPGPGDYVLPSTLHVSGGSWFGMRSALQAVLEPESHYSFPFMSQHTAGGETHPSQRSSASSKLAGMRQVRVRILSSQRSIPLVVPGAFTRPRAKSSGRKSAQRQVLDLESTMCVLKVGSPTRCCTNDSYVRFESVRPPAISHSTQCCRIRFRNEIQRGQSQERAANAS